MTALPQFAHKSPKLSGSHQTEPVPNCGRTFVQVLMRQLRQSVERLTRRLEQLGYEVHLEPRPAAA